MTLQAQSFRAIILNPGVYRTRTDLNVKLITDENFRKIDSIDYIIEVPKGKYLDYKIVSEDENGYVIIKVLPKVKLIDEEKEDGKIVHIVRRTSDKQLKSDVDNAFNYYFALKKDNFPILGKTLLSSKITGEPLVQPFKLRPGFNGQSWELEGEFTVSYNFGLRLKIGNHFKQNFISFVPYGFGVGAAKYFKQTTDGTLTEKTDEIAVTYYQGGIILTLGKINLGFIGGFDAMIDKKNDWFYQGKPWMSFGIGYKFKDD